MPMSSALPFFKWWNYYDHADSSDVWYEISFDIKQADTNQVDWATDSCMLNIKFAIFDMDLLHSDYPNYVGGVWSDGPFGNQHCNTTTWICYRETHTLILHDDSIANGLGYDTDDDVNVWITFPTTEAKGTFQTMTAKFRLDPFGNNPPCETCYIAVYVENNGWPLWRSYMSYEWGNLKLKRLAAPVTWPSSVTPDTSEIVSIRRMEYLSNIGSWQRTNCPHIAGQMFSSLSNWHDSSIWGGSIPDPSTSEIVIPDNTNVIIRSCSLYNSDENTPFKRIRVPYGSSLIFDDVNIDLHVEELLIEGSLYIGSHTCRLYSEINIYLHSPSGGVNLIHDAWASGRSKGIVATGSDMEPATIDIHGKQFHPTWTRIAKSVYVFVSDFLYGITNFKINKFLEHVLSLHCV